MSVVIMVLVPFYRGAVVFKLASELVSDLGEFSSPFIEERLYLAGRLPYVHHYDRVLVPFYRGAVVFSITKKLNQSTDQI